MTYMDIEGFLLLISFPAQTFNSAVTHHIK